jgi:NAD(P)H-flavin reductase
MALAAAPPRSTAAVMIPAAARVASVEKETHDTFTLTVEAADESVPLRGFEPGQFSMLYAAGVGELPISISGDPEERGRLVYTIRSVGQATHALVTKRANDRIGVRGPFGTSWPLREAHGRDLLVVGGGIGLAPLRPVIFHVLRHRGDYGRLIVLYGARNPKDLLFRKQLAAWNYVPETQVLTTVDYGGLSWRGHVGVVTTLFRYIRIRPENTTAMICGPEVMMRFVVLELRNRGFRSDDIYISAERNMRCAVGHCGHCQMGPLFVCKDGPVFAYNRIAPWMDRYEL